MRGIKTILISIVYVICVIALDIFVFRNLSDQNKINLLLILFNTIAFLIITIYLDISRKSYEVD